MFRLVYRTRNSQANPGPATPIVMPAEAGIQQGSPTKREMSATSQNAAHLKKTLTSTPRRTLVSVKLFYGNQASGPQAILRSHQEKLWESTSCSITRRSRAWPPWRTVTPEDMKKEMEAWMAWAAGCGDSLADMGEPLGGGRRLTKSGSTPSDRDFTAYSILEADDMETATGPARGSSAPGVAGRLRDRSPRGDAQLLSR